MPRAWATFLTLLTDRIYDVTTFTPGGDELRKHFGGSCRSASIRSHPDARMIEASADRDLMTKIAGEFNHIARADPAQQSHVIIEAAIAAAIVDEDDLVLQSRSFQDSSQARVEFRKIFFLVVDRMTTKDRERSSQLAAGDDRLDRSDRRPLTVCGAATMRREPG